MAHRARSGRPSWPGPGSRSWWSRGPARRPASPTRSTCRPAPRWRPTPRRRSPAPPSWPGCNRRPSTRWPSFPPGCRWSASCSRWPPPTWSRPGRQGCHRLQPRPASSHQPGPVDGRPLVPGHGGRLPRRPVGGRAPGQVLPDVHDRGRHRPAGQGAGDGRRCGRPAGHRHRPAARRRGPRLRRAGCGQRRGAEPRSQIRRARPRDPGGAGGYAKEQSAEYLAKQQELLAAEVAASDVVITTAQIPGRKAPGAGHHRDGGRDVRRARSSSTLAADSGGNCELSVAGEDVAFHGVDRGRAGQPAGLDADPRQLPLRPQHRQLPRAAGHGRRSWPPTSRTRSWPAPAWSGRHRRARADRRGAGSHRTPRRAGSDADVDARRHRPATDGRDGGDGS